MKSKVIMLLITVVYTVEAKNVMCSNFQCKIAIFVLNNKSQWVKHQYAIVSKLVCKKQNRFVFLYV